MSARRVSILTENRKLLFATFVMLLRAISTGTGESKVPVNVSGALFDFGMTRRVINSLQGLRWTVSSPNETDEKLERQVFQAFHWNEKDVSGEHDGRELFFVFDSMLINQASEVAIKEALTEFFGGVEGVARVTTRMALEELDGKWQDWSGESFRRYIAKDVAKAASQELFSVDNRPFVCPLCGKRRLATILYGTAEYTPEVKHELKTGKLVLGEANTKGKPPTWKCLNCGLELWKMSIGIGRKVCNEVPVVAKSTQG